jgi:hypothetical protein
MAQALRRVVNADGNGYDRYYDAIAGAAVVYENVGGRKCFGYVNGLYFEVDWPDCSTFSNGDQGRPVSYRIRPEVDPATGHVVGWVLYTYVYSGDRDHRSEWSVQVA